MTGYYDFLWAGLDIEKINLELQDFQNRSSSEDSDRTIFKTGSKSMNAAEKEK